MKSVSTKKACRHFFQRVQACRPDIHVARADKMKLKGKKRARFMAEQKAKSKRAPKDLDKLCDMVAWKVKQQLTQMDDCYKQKQCADFAACFVKMADAEKGPAMKHGNNPLQELKNKLRKMNQHRGHQHGPAMLPPGLRPSPTPKLGGHGHHHGHDHGHGHDHSPRPRPRPTPRPK